MKINLFYSLAIFAISLFMFSCSQSDEDVAMKTSHERAELLEGLENGFTLPKGLELSPEEAFEFIHSLPNVELKSMNQSLKIMLYLSDVNLVGVVYDSLEDGQNFSDANLPMFLSENQLVDLASYSIPVETSNLESRSCWNSGGCRYCCGYNPYLSCWKVRCIGFVG